MKVSRTYRIYIAVTVLVAGAMLVAAAPGYRAFKTEPYLLIYPENFGNRVFIPPDNPLTKEGVFLGRMLFYEPKLSSNNKISCASCHKQELAFTDGKTFSEGVDKQLTDRNAMSLANLLWVKNLFWDGRVEGLEQQAMVPITNAHEMNQSLDAGAKKLAADKKYARLFAKAFGNDSISGERIVKALAQFERTLISANARYDQYLRGEYKPTEQEINGMNLFMTIPNPASNIRGANCVRCHGTVKTFIELYHNNGLDSFPKDNGRQVITGRYMDKGSFRVPTLRNIALTAPYMHDGRFKTLEEVVDHYNEHLVQVKELSPLLQEASNSKNGKTLELTAAEKKDLLQFLNMLTDSSFITDKRFADPNQSDNL
ncbi:MAG: cytochrome c peroxidase [Ferruginibacter sp.]